MKKILGLTILTLTMLSTFGCASSYVGTPVYIEHGVHVKQTNSKMFRGYLESVKSCMGVSQPLHMPEITIVKSSKVKCGRRSALGCYVGSRFTKGILTVPARTGSNVIKHEFIHHVLLHTKGDIDNGHKTNWYQRCS